MRIVDGAQRARAMQMRGQETIFARLFDGDDAAAFVAAVEANTRHGLRLTRAECCAAVARILGLYPRWSDRAIAQVCGVSDKTVAAIRSCSSADSPQLNRRVGKDGRVRPVDNREGRRIARQLLDEHPDSSLRWIAKMAGVSPNTVRRVRDSRVGQPVVPQPRTRDEWNQATVMRNRIGVPPDWDRRRAMENLRRDPSLKMKDSGKRLLRWLGACVDIPDCYDDMMNGVPSCWTETVMWLALDCSARWTAFADELSQRQAGRRLGKLVDQGVLPAVMLGDTPER